MTTASANYFSRSTSKSVAQAIAAVERALAARQFAVLWHLDINEKLREKGLPEGPPFHVLEVCSAPRAQQALETNQQVGYFLPCKIVVYQDARTGGTEVGLQRPQLMVDLLGDPALEPLAQEVETLLSAAVAEAAGHDGGGGGVGLW
jgi:uncharacterized protein (DUF302 family)